MPVLPVTAVRSPHAPALSDLTRTLTYAELAAAAAALAGRLAAFGVRAGERVATLQPTTLEHAVAIHGVSWLGATVVPMHPRLTRDELAWQLGDIAPRLLLTGAATPKGLPGKTIPIGELLAAGGSAREPASHRPSDLAAILYTSGTTGRPKPVPLSWANFAASVAGSTERLGTAPDDDWLCPLPLAHVAGLAVLHRSATLGTAATLLEGFDAEIVASLLASGRITMVSLVPTMLRRLVGLGRPLPAPRLRVMLVGGGPADDETLARAFELGLPIAHSYGLTETASQLTTMPIADARRKVGTAGRPIAGAEVQIRDEQGAPAVSGTIWVRGPMVLAGYLDRPEENARRFDSEGWFETGDLGWLDAEGYLTIETRREDLIVTGGENVYPAEVEAALARHPAVAECAVFGVPDPEWGQRVAAAIVPNPNLPVPAPEELATFLRARLAPFKVPKTWSFPSELPRTASGKVRRAKLGDGTERPTTT